MPPPRTNLKDMLSKLGSSSGGAGESADSSEETAVPAPKFSLSRSSAVFSKVKCSSDHPGKADAVSESATVKLRSPLTPGVEKALAPPLPLSRAMPGESSKKPVPMAGNKLTRTASKLDEMPTEKIQAMIIKNQDEKIALIDKQSALAEGGDEGDSNEDSDMIQMKLQLHTKRIKELKEALEARKTTTPRTSAPSAGVSSTTAVHTPSALGNAADNDINTPSRKILGEIKLSDDEDESSPKRAKATFKRWEFTPPPPIDVSKARDQGAESYPSPPSDLPRTSSSRQVPPADVDMEDDFHDFDMAAFEADPGPSTGRRKQAKSSPRKSSQRGPQPPTPTQAPRPVEPVKLDVRYPWDKEVSDKLKHYFKIPSFRNNQKEAVDETMAGKDVFVLMPTGGGKSLTYQLPAVCNGGNTRGVTFVISPLISLINDQTRHLCKLSIPAIAYTGEMTQKDKDAAHYQLSMREPYTRVVYVTPEMMTMGGTIKGILRQLLTRKRLARFVIDEAHCVSQWGHDFREDYLKLGTLRQTYPGVPIMALTATAQQKVQEDIIRSLGIRGCSVLTQSFNRANLHYEVRPKMKNVLENMVAFIQTQGANACGIIYCSSRDKCENLAKTLREDHDLGAYHYHAGMSKGDRRKIQEGWQERKFEIIVATVAFGMGIDKPDVRYVIHQSLPRSLEGYYQETGRAGRDGNPSNCVLYFTFGDYKKVISLIDMDTNMTRDQKDRQKASMAEVLRFCNNKTDCRRTQVLAFFNEIFDPILCQQGCDTCLARDRNTYTSEDVTDDAVKIIKMIQAFDKGDRITEKNAADCYRGLGLGSGKNLASNPYFGVGKDNWKKGEAERLVQALIVEGALEEFIVSSRAGWSHAYLKTGKKVNDFLRGGKRLKMEFRQQSPQKAPKQAKLKSNGKSGKAALAGQGGISAYARQVSNPVARKRSHQQIMAEEKEFDNSPWGDTDDEYAPSEDLGNDTTTHGGDAIEVSDTEEEDADVPLSAIKRRKVIATTAAKIGTGERGSAKTAKKQSRLSSRGSRALKPKGPSSAVSKTVLVRDDSPTDLPPALATAKDVDREGTGTPHERCLRSLQTVYEAIRRSNPGAPQIDKSLLELIATILPTDDAGLFEITDLTHAQRKAYSAQILSTCRRYSGGNAAMGAEARRAALAPKEPQTPSQTVRNIQSYAFAANLSVPPKNVDEKAKKALPVTEIIKRTTPSTVLSVAKTGLNRQRF